MILTPTDSELRIELKGNLAAMLSAATNTKRSPETGDLSLQVEMVAGAGFEPAIPRRPAFSNSLALYGPLRSRFWIFWRCTARRGAVSKFFFVVPFGLFTILDFFELYGSLRCRFET